MLLEVQFLPLKWSYVVLLSLVLRTEVSSCIKRTGNVLVAQMEHHGEGWLPWLQLQEGSVLEQEAEVRFPNPCQSG